MCGRYVVFTDTEYKELRDIVDKVERKNREVKTGEIFPTNSAPVLFSEHGTVRADAVVWGFPHFKGSGVIINARSETAAEKRMFAKPLLTRRCIVPAGGFFEWDKEKNKHLFTRSDTPLYMAGLYNEFGGEKRYVILTRGANSSMVDIHDRMPVILDRADVREWLNNTEAAMHIMQTASPELVNRVV